MEAALTNYRGITGSIYSDHFYRATVSTTRAVRSSGVRVGRPAPYRHRTLRPDASVLADCRLRRDASWNASRANRVEWHPATGQRRIFYELSAGDRDRLRLAARTGVEIMFAAGAREVLLPSTETIGPLPTPRFRRAEDAIHCASLTFSPHQTTITSSHCQATVKMGEDPVTSAVDSRGRSHHVRHLVVCDSSVFPDSCGATPMLSIMTLARYQGRRIAAELGR